MYQSPYANDVEHELHFRFPCSGVPFVQATDSSHTKSLYNGT